MSVKISPTFDTGFGAICRFGTIRLIVLLSFSDRPATYVIPTNFLGTVTDVELAFGVIVETSFSGSSLLTRIVDTFGDVLWLFNTLCTFDYSLGMYSLLNIIVVGFPLSCTGKSINIVNLGLI